MVGRWTRIGIIWWLVALLVVACGDESRPTPDYSGVLTPPNGPGATVTPPFQANTNITPLPTDTPTTPGQPTATTSPVPATPIIKPTPAVPTEGSLTSDDLGTGAWSDTEVLWSPTGDVFLLHVLREGADSDFYYIVRPPDSIQGSFKLSRAVYGSMSWSSDGRYLLYIEKDADSQAGAVKVIDLQRDASHDRKLIAGPCTGAAWLSASKVVATCGLAVYNLTADSQNDTPEILFKLENNRFPGTQVDLSLLFQALPSPNGQTLAIFGVRRQKSATPVGDIAFYNLASKKLDILERNNRPVTMVDWTPDSKYLILRNLTGDASSAYTFDYYLADPSSLKITQNLTKSNDKCDPVLGAKPECQGQQPPTVQSNRVLFAPDGQRYFFSGLRLVARPNAPLASAERLSSGKLGAKSEQLVETAPGERISGLTWLPGGHYFYSIGFGSAAPKAILDGKSVEVKGGKVVVGPKTTPAPTKAGVGSLNGFGLPDQAVTTPPVPATTQPPAIPTSTQAAPLPTAPVSSPSPATPQAPPPANTTSATTQAASPSPTLLIVNSVAPSVSASAPVSPSTTETALPSPVASPPTITTTPVPRGTSLLGFDTATAQAGKTAPPPIPVIPPTPAPVTAKTTDISPTASQYPKPAAYSLSPTGNWLVVIERVAGSDKGVQFQVRLVPFSLKP